MNINDRCPDCDEFILNGEGEACVDWGQCLTEQHEDVDQSPDDLPE